MWGKMDKTVNGHITLDTYLVFDKAEVTSENHSLVNGKIDIDEYIRRTYIDVETLAKCSERSLIETVEFVEYGNKSLIECLNMIVTEVKHSISAEFEDSYVTCAKKIHTRARGLLATVL